MEKKNKKIYRSIRQIKLISSRMTKGMPAISSKKKLERNKKKTNLVKKSKLENINESKNILSTKKSNPRRSSWWSKRLN